MAIFLTTLLIYFIPTIIAAFRHKKNLAPIVVLNVLGFLVITWIIALIWAVAYEKKD